MPSKQLTPTSWNQPTNPGPQSPQTQPETQAVIPSAVITSGVIPTVFTFTDLAASQSALQASIGIGAVSVPMMFSGSIVALVLKSNAAKTAGTATFTVYVDQTPTGATLSWATGTRAKLSWAEGAYPFLPDSEVDIRATTDSAFAPSTADLNLFLYTTYSP